MPITAPPLRHANGHDAHRTPGGARSSRGGRRSAPAGGAGGPGIGQTHGLCQQPAKHRLCAARPLARESRVSGRLPGMAITGLGASVRPSQAQLRVERTDPAVARGTAHDGRHRLWKALRRPGQRRRGGHGDRGFPLSIGGAAGSARRRFGGDRLRRRERRANRVAEHAGEGGVRQRPRLLGARDSRRTDKDHLRRGVCARGVVGRPVDQRLQPVRPAVPGQLVDVGGRDPQPPSRRRERVGRRRLRAPAVGDDRHPHPRRRLHAGARRRRSSPWSLP